MAGTLTLEDRFLGCLLAGACGDALGEPVEFSSLDQIFRKYGRLEIPFLPFSKLRNNHEQAKSLHCAVLTDVAKMGAIAGPQELKIAADGKARFTDDTQMTLFTAEGLLSTVLSLLQSNRDLKTFEVEDALPGLHQSYLRWLATQGEESWSPLFHDVKDRGLLVNEKPLRHRRGPGMTCLMSIKSGSVGTAYNEINDRKGCGGVMRVAPCGLLVHSAFSFLSADDKAELAFKLGCLSAAITHTHPSGWLSSGCQAAIISRILSGDMLDNAIKQTIPLLEREPNNEETLAKMTEATDLALDFLRRFEDAPEPSDPLALLKQEVVLEHFERLGEGWIGEEALGISLYCALITQKDRDVEKALCYSVNHRGDSDSTGAIAGNIVGALYGEAAIPPKWRDKIEMGELIREVSRDLLNVTTPNVNKESLSLKYPTPITVVNGEEYYKNKENL